MKYVSPATTETAFNCPHCGALTTQTWFQVHCRKRSEENPTPPNWNLDDAEAENFETIEDAQVRKDLKKVIMAMASGVPKFYQSGDWISCRSELLCTHVSKCFNCDQLAIWIHNSLIYPKVGEAMPANPDLPEDIRRDYNEANGVLSSSPRSSAALLRLCIQKLCIFLGERGKNINDDISSLVQKGLDPKIQMALDVVRVIGNEAVHPGEIDLRDDHGTALNLFKLVNLISEKMISEPKHVEEMYASLPQEKVKAIEKRDKN